MATINIISEPEQLRPTNYPIVFKFDETSIGSAAKAQATPNFTANVTNGQRFIFYIASLTTGGNRIVVVARDNPSNGDIPTSTTTSLDDITVALIEALNSNPAFSAYYIASYFLPGLLNITALKNGTKWNTLFENGLGGSPTGSGFLTGGSDEYLSDGTDSFSVFADFYEMNDTTAGVYSNNSIFGIGTKKARFLRSKNDENVYYFDFSDFAKGFVNDFDVPQLRQTTFTELDNCVNNYSIQYGYQYTSGNTFNRVVTESSVLNNWLINSSLPFNVQSDDFQEYQLYTGRTFLTNQPRAGKIVDQNESNPLAYFHYATGATNFVTSASIEYTFTDGAVLSALTAHYFDTTISTDGIYYADLGPSNLPITSIENLFTKEIASYEVWFQRKVLGSYSDIFTERIKFILDKTCKDNKRNIIWKNELGGIDSWTFNGKDSQSTEIQQSIYSRFELNPRDKYISNKATGIIDKSTKINCSSGWLDEDHFNWMKNSLIGSPAVWINESGNIMERIILVDVTVQKDSDNLMHNILLTYEKAEYENHIGR